MFTQPERKFYLEYLQIFHLLSARSEFGTNFLKCVHQLLQDGVSSVRSSYKNSYAKSKLVITKWRKQDIYVAIYCLIDI